jgi:hypothetical protein
MGRYFVIAVVPLMVPQKDNPGDDVERLREIQKARGYRPGWVYLARLEALARQQQRRTG